MIIKIWYFILCSNIFKSDLKYMYYLENIFSFTHGHQKAGLEIPSDLKNLFEASC